MTSEITASPQPKHGSISIKINRKEQQEYTSERKGSKQIKEEHPGSILRPVIRTISLVQLQYFRQM